MLSAYAQIRKAVLMTFSSLSFLFIFFPIVFLIYCVCKNHLLRNIILIVASLIFYAYGEPVAVFIMLCSICLNYLFGLMCAGVIGGKSDANASTQEMKIPIMKRIGLIAAIVLNIGLLVVFKYSDFFLDCIGLQEYELHIKLPIGISFFTFQGLSYVIDVYRDKKCVQKNIMSVMLYISFFPQLIAGPIVKYHDIESQLILREFSIDRILRGLQRFSFGLAKKVLIAGPMGLMVDTIYNLEGSTIGIATAWIAAISYMFQIYFDFSGYSDMAIGLGCIFGFDFKENFDKPYAAGSIKKFWRKWHISLSTWFKEYVYIPLGGNRHGVARTYINKFIVFILTGLWHGANWTFVCWGVLHGLGLVVEDMLSKLVGRIYTKTPKFLKIVLNIFGHAYTLLFVMIAFVIFRADNLSIAANMLYRMLYGNGKDAIAFSMMTPTYLIAFVLAVVCSSSALNYIIPKIKPGFMQVFSMFAYVASIMMLITGGYNPFIYFRF